MNKKPKNYNLNKAKRFKNDEFYTQLSDIENELKHYRKHFENKTVLCNCNDYKTSNFFHYFLYNFKFLKLKKLISIQYQRHLSDLFQRNKSERAAFAEYTNPSNNKVPNTKEIKIKYLKGDGDFRSKECIELLKQSDIIVTNPPFSLFRVYVAQLIKYNKKFLIIGHQNAIAYKEIFKLIKDNKIWLGYGFKGNSAHFINTHYKDYAAGWDHREGLIRIPGVQWFTNLNIDKQYKKINLCKTYNPKEYPKYDNYDAININKIKDIPINYDGAMGVPITFISKYNSEQFEILGIFGNKKGKSNAIIQGSPTYINKQSKKYVGPVINGKAIYTRIIIKSKKSN